MDSIPYISAINSLIHVTTYIQFDITSVINIA